MIVPKLKERLRSALQRWTNETPEGQGLVEYALILVLVVFVVFIVVVWIGPWVGNVFSNVIYNL
jgi:Flp pilus assembly pilin Flp